MIDSILHYVQESEEEADKKIEEARKKSSQILEEAVHEADLQQKKLEADLEKTRQSRWQSLKDKEAKEDEKAQEKIRVYLERFREKAYQKSDPVTETLISIIGEL